MLKKIVLLGVVVIFLLTSCALPGGNSTKSDIPTKAPAKEIMEPTAEEVVEPTAEEVVEPTAEEVVEPTAEEVVEPTAEEVVEPTAEEVAAPEGTNFRDDFDIPTDSWADDYILTTQAVTRDQMLTEKSTIQDGILEWRIRDAETYIYKFVNGPKAADVVLEAKWISKGQSLMGIALVCRAAEDYSSWYEARISAQGNWEILKYDKSIKDANQFKNPYVSLKKGVAKAKQVRPAQDNISKFSCIGSNLSYEINGLKGCVSPDPAGDKSKECKTSNNDIKGGGMVGLGVMSSTYLPAQILVDYFSASAP